MAMIENESLYWCDFQKINNKWITRQLPALDFIFWKKKHCVFSGLWVKYFILQHKCFPYNPSALEMSRQRERMAKWDVDLPSYFANAFIHVLVSVENQRLQKFPGLRAKPDWGRNRRRTSNLIESLHDVEIDADSDLLSICTDNEGVRDLPWSCLTFVSCVMENNLRALVQANRSCCIAPWIQLRVRGAQMAVFMCFLCWLACCWVWCGLQRGEVKRTNTFLLKILLWSEHF